MAENTTPTPDVDQSDPKDSAGWKLAGAWFAGLASFYYLLSRVVPYQLPDAEAIADYSFPQVLHEGFVRHWQFGRDIIYTFGPWGFLATGFHPANHIWHVTLWTLFSVIFWWMGWRVTGHFTANPLLRGLWLVLFTGLPPDASVDYLGWIVLLLYFHFFVADRPFTALHALMVATLAVVGLIKFTVFLMVVVVIGVISADTVVRLRRFPWILIVYIASFLSCWLTAGQRPGTLGPYLLNSWRIAEGFSEAMMLTSPWAVQEVAFFLVMTLWVCWQTVALAREKNRTWEIFPLVGLLGILLLLFKRSFVRHDAHATSAPLGFLLLCLLIVAAGWPMVRNKSRWFVFLNLLPLVAALCWAGVANTRYINTTLLSDFVRTFSARNLLEPIQLLSGSQRVRIEYAQAYAKFRAQYPMPPVAGTADEYSFNQVTIFAHDIPYQPRPVIQSFKTYSPALAEINAAHLRNDRAAENLLFDLLTIDDAYPSLADGLSWPEFLTRYDIEAVQPPFVWMKKARNPRSWKLEPLGEASLRFGQRIAIPTVNEDPIWARITVEKTTRGRIASTLYKPPMLTLHVFLPGGRELRYRLVPGMARAGFLLSPLVDDVPTFGLLAAKDGLRALTDKQVIAISISAETASGTTALYETPIRLELFRLHYPKQDLHAIPGPRELK